MINKTS